MQGRRGVEAGGTVAMGTAVTGSRIENSKWDVGEVMVVKGNGGGDGEGASKK